jgi:biopolymer transport protein ExbD
LAAAPRVHLRASGVLLLDGEVTTLGGLQRACAGKEVVDLRVDDAVPWARLQWVLAALERAPAARVRFEFADGAAEACFRSDFWTQDARHLVGGHTRAVLTVDGTRLLEPGLAAELGAEAARIEREYRLRPLGELRPHPSQLFGAVAAGLRAFREAGVEVEFRFLFPDDPVPESIPALPDDASEWPDIAGVWNSRCSCAPGFIAVDLPVADMAEQDVAEEHDRVFVHLGRDGGLFRYEEVSLDALAEQLAAAKERYELKMKQQGKRGVEELPGGGFVSKLYVLIRADGAAPALHVGWILHILASNGLYKVQYAVRRAPPVAEEHCVDAGYGILQSFLPTDNLPRLARANEPVVRAYVDPGAYGIGPTGGVDLETIGKLAREEYERARADDSASMVAAVHVARGVEWGRVIAAVNVLTRAGFEKIDFHGLPPPDEATRRLSPLPR